MIILSELLTRLRALREEPSTDVELMGQIQKKKIDKQCGRHIHFTGELTLLETSQGSPSVNTEELENAYSAEGLYPYPKRCIISSNPWLVEEKYKDRKAPELDINAAAATAANAPDTSIYGSNNGNFL